MSSKTSSSMMQLSSLVWIVIFVFISSLLKPEIINAAISTPTPDEIFIDGYGVPMVLIPAGSFQMGSENGDKHERLVHTVTLDDYYVDQYEVTNAQYERCVDAGVCSPPKFPRSPTRDSYFSNPEYDNYPVIWVEWHEANNFCGWRDARLPTEAEWEKAARGGLKNKVYPWGDMFPSFGKNNRNGANFIGPNYKRIDFADTEPVGSFGANGYGLYDMVGNVSEFVADWYDEDYYQYSPTDNPQGPEAGEFYVIRGGSWNGSFWTLRSANRTSVYGYPQNEVGFRCARLP